MSGVTALPQLLASMSPALLPCEYVFASVATMAEANALIAEAVGIFREEEGITVICRREAAAQAGLPFDAAFRQITLRVHSSLEAVGFLAAVSTALAAAGIPCNAISARYHDHLFIPADKAYAAMRVLSSLGKSS